MTTEITNTNWFLDDDNFEGTVSFKGKKGTVIHAFSYGCNFTIGKTEINLLSIDDDFKWDEIFTKNGRKEMRIEQIGDWKYNVYGKIKSINPVVIDCGEFELETGSWTNDINVIGEFVFWCINRLDILKK